MTKVLPLPKNLKMGISQLVRYPSQSAYVAELQRLKTTYPDKFNYYTDRKSATGNFDLYWSVIGNPTKPAIFYVGCLHAFNEWGNGHMLMHFMEKLLNPNDNQAEFNSKFLDYYCFVCIPIVNPYGYFNGVRGLHHNGNGYQAPRASEINWHGRSDWDNQFKYYYGVNLNRNFPTDRDKFLDTPFSVRSYWNGSHYGSANYFMMPFVMLNDVKTYDGWNGTGQYPNHLLEVDADQYDGCGISAFSEPETQLIRDLFDRYNIIGFADWHTMNYWQTNNSGLVGKNVVDNQAWKDLVTQAVVNVNNRNTQSTKKMETPSFTYIEDYGGGVPTSVNWVQTTKGIKTVDWETGTYFDDALWTDAYIDIFYKSIYWMQIEVEPITLSSLTLSPQSATLKVGEQQQFTPQGKDQYGNVMDLTGRNLIYNVHKA